MAAIIFVNRIFCDEALHTLQTKFVYRLPIDQRPGTTVSSKTIQLSGKNSSLVVSVQCYITNIYLPSLVT